MLGKIEDLFGDDEDDAPAPVTALTRLVDGAPTRLAQRVNGGSSDGGDVAVTGDRRGGDTSTTIGPEEAGGVAGGDVVEATAGAPEIGLVAASGVGGTDAAEVEAGGVWSGVPRDPADVAGSTTEVAASPLVDEGAAGGRLEPELALEGSSPSSDDASSFDGEVATFDGSEPIGRDVGDVCGSTGPSTREPDGVDEGDEAGEAPFYGLSWDVVERVCDMRSVDAALALRFALTIRGTGRSWISVANLARAQKRTETATIEIVSQLPSLFRLTHRDARVTLHNAPVAPDDLTREQRQAAERDRILAAKAAQRDEAQRRKDAEDTTFNRLRLQLEAAGMGRDEARLFVGHITRTYGWDPSFKAAERAAATKPGSVKGYVIAILKGGAAANAARGDANVVRTQTRPDPTGVTRLIGWEDREVNGTRHQLFRMATGRVKRSLPAPGTKVPSFAEDPGSPWEA